MLACRYRISDFGRVGRDCNEVARDRLLVSQSLKRPLTGRACIGHRLQRREGLGGHDEKCLVGAQIARVLGKVRAVHVRDEAERHVALAVVLQGLIGHDRAEIGATDTMLITLRMRLPVCPLHWPSRT